MGNFNDTDFLLLNAYGKKLYHEVAASLPVIDPHNHIDAAALAGNIKFENICQLWVKNDPYKHRAMRIYGIKEELITGNGSDKEKFFAWAKCFPLTAGNPLFHWSCMELKYLFQFNEILSEKNAPQLWEKANDLLKEDAFGGLNIIKRLGVEMLCTSDDLLDTLEHHTALAAIDKTITCLPSLRSDSVVAFNQPTFHSWLQKLGLITGIPINNLDSYKLAITKRLDFFDATGCLLSDHSFDSGFTFMATDDVTATALFDKVQHNELLSAVEIVCLQSHLLHFLGKEYAVRKWKMQLHIGAYRYTSTVLRKKAGPAGGYSCIGNTVDVPSLCTFLDGLDIENRLPKTILYTLNPADNAVFASITGSYAEDGVPGKIQFGPAWWFNDHYEGIIQQLTALSSYGLLGLSIGMTTDSRSLLSFLRHDYYRRILCNLIGEWAEEGKLPDDWDFLSDLIKNISYYNIKNWIKK